MHLTRHRDMIGTVNLNTPLVVAGAGSIGSYAILALTKLGFNNIIVLDDGIVEEENIAPQFYRPRDFGKLKVNCLTSSIRDLTGVDLIAIPKKYDGETNDLVNEMTKGKHILILAVDSMAARKSLFLHTSYSALVDARMAIEYLAVYSFSVDGADDYRATLHSDENSVQEACTNKAISYTSLIAGGLVAKSVLDRLKGNAKPFSVINFDIGAMDMVKL